MDNETVEKYKKAGKIAAEAMEYGKGLIKKGNLLVDAADKIEKKIFELGAKPAFPVQISLNETAAHYCPDFDDKTAFEEQLVCLDVGAQVDGFVGDNACSVDLSGKYLGLVKASKMALEEASKLIKPGIKICEIGRAIEEAITSFGFNPVKNLSGHGLEQYSVHTFPTIPNFNNGDETKLEKGQVIAIEPFATEGSGMIYEKGIANVFILKLKRPIRVGFIRNMLMEINRYEGMPFTKRWLYSRFSPAKINFAFTQFRNLGMLKEYPPLVEKSGGFISQAENSFLIDDEVVLLTKTD